MAPARDRLDSDPLLIDLALQGGGAHGAFTWGVLDRLLEERQLEIEAISGTSAGAMNAAVLAHGYCQNGPLGRRPRLKGSGGRSPMPRAFSPFRRGPLDVLLGRWSLDHSPLFAAMDMMARWSRPMTSIRPAPIHCARSWPTRSISRGSHAARSSCSSRRRMSGAAGTRVPQCRL